MKIAKILVPTDFSKCAQPAVDEAMELAAKFDAEVVLAHVMEAPIYPAVTFAGAANVPMVHEEIAQACDEELAKAVAKVPATAGVYQLLDEEKKVFAIKGVDDLRLALTDLLGTSEKARFFLFEEDPMFSKREMLACEQSSFCESGSRSRAILNSGSWRKPVTSLPSA